MTVTLTQFFAVSFMLANNPHTKNYFSSSYSKPASFLRRSRPLSMSLLIGDLVSLSLVFQFTHFVLGAAFDPLAPIYPVLVTAIVASLYIADTYRPEPRVTNFSATPRILVCSALFGFVIVFLSQFSKLGASAPAISPQPYLLGLSIFSLWAVLQRFLVSTWVRSRAKQHTCLVLGESSSTTQFQKDYQSWNPLGNLVTFGPHMKSSTKSQSADLLASRSVSGENTHLWSEVVVSQSADLSVKHIRELIQLKLEGVSVYRLGDLYEALWKKLPPALVQDTWLAFGGGFYLINNRAQLKIKRFFDILIASLLILFLSPLMLLTALAIRVESPGPFLYSQQRNGLNSQPFRIYKFRSMRRDAEKFGVQWAQKKDPRITKIGYIIRMLRIDELPQLWNVVKGDMSLIGPRPERPEFDVNLAGKIPYYSLRYLVKPGITGWAQVMYPYGASIEDAYEKLSYDLYYIKNHSVFLDLSIFLKTIRVVVLGKGR